MKLLTLLIFLNILIVNIFGQNNPGYGMPLSKVIGSTIEVSTEAEFKSAITNVISSGGNKTILINNGTYQIANLTNGTGIYFPSTVNNIVIRSKSGNREQVILKGKGPTGSVTHGFLIGGDNVTISDITIKEVKNHGIQIQGENDSDSCLIHNIHFVDINEQMIKVSGTSGSTSNRSNNGIVENCLFEFTSGVAYQYYTGGIDAHISTNWIARDNLFKGIRSPNSATHISEHAIHFWDDCSGTLVERNIIINCDRGIGFGLLGGTDLHINGIIRNNIYYSDGNGKFDDSGISLANAQNVKVYNNTIISDTSYWNSIEYRFSNNINCVIKNNLTNLAIVARDGGQATVSNNYQFIKTDVNNIFESISNKNFHIKKNTLTTNNVINKGVSLNDVTDDIDKNSRPQGTGFDIGADEYLEGNLINDIRNDNKLINNYPNPFKDKTTIKYSIENKEFTTLTIYDVYGRVIQTPVNEIKNQGEYEFEFDAKDLKAGIYYYELKVGNIKETKKMIVIK